MLALALPLAMLLFLGNLWGLAAVIAKAVGGAGVPPLGYGFWQSTGAGVLLLLACRVAGIRLGWTSVHLRYFAMMGLLGLLVPMTVFYTVVREIPAGVMALILTLAPLVTYLMVLVMRMERFVWLRAAGIALGLFAALLLVVPKGGLPDPGMVPYVLLGMLTPIFFAAANVYGERHRPRDAHAVSLAAGMLLAAGTGFMVLTLATGTFHPIWREANLANVLIGSHALLAAMAFILFFTLLKRGGPVYVSQVAYIITLTGIGWGMLFFGERHSAWLWLAVALMFVGVALVNRPQPATAAAPAE